MFAKFENEKWIICPRNGYVGDTAISNIDIYFENNPDIAEKEGWYKVIPLEEPADNIDYELRGNLVYEIVNEEYIEETDKHAEQTHDTNETIV